MPIDSVPKDSQEVKVFKIVKAKAKQAAEFAEFVKSMTRMFKERKPKCKIGVISSNIYRNNPVEQHDSISTLPSELQCLIWFMLDNQADRLMLALTCKWHAAMYESVKDKPFQSTSRKISPKSKIKAMPGRRRAPAKKRLTDKDRLEMLWRLQEWEPLSTRSRYKLCYKCICFLPRGYTFYPEKTSPFGWGGRAMDLNAISAAEARIVGYRCPECCAFTAGQLASETKEYKEAERKTRKVLETKW